MDALNTIFNAWFQIVPYDLIVGVQATLFIAVVLLTLTDFWSTI